MTFARCSLSVILLAAVTNCSLLAEDISSERKTATHPAVLKTIEQWKERRTALHTLGIVIESKHENHPDATGDEGEKLIPGSVKIPVKTTWYLDLKNGRYRREEINTAHNPIDNSRTPKYYISLWDGEHYKRFRLELEHGQNEEGNDQPSVSLVESHSDNRKSAFLFLDDYPLFYSLGYIKWSDKNFSDMLAIELEDGDFLRVRDWKAGQKKPFVLVRGDRRPGIIHEYTVDPEKGGAITHFRSSVSPDSKTFYFGPQITTIETKFQMTDFGWFPASWTLQMGEKPNIQSVSTHKVVELKFNPKLDRSLFQIEE